MRTGPFPSAQPDAELGLIFLRADPGDAGGAGRPAILALPDYVFRGYGADDRIVYGTGGVVATEAIPARAEALFVDPRVACLHVRSARNNCYQCRIDHQSGCEIERRAAAGVFSLLCAKMRKAEADEGAALELPGYLGQVNAGSGMRCGRVPVLEPALWGGVAPLLDKAGAGPAFVNPSRPDKNKVMRGIMGVQEDCLLHSVFPFFNAPRPSSCRCLLPPRGGLAGGRQGARRIPSCPWRR